MVEAARNVRVDPGTGDLEGTGAAELTCATDNAETRTRTMSANLPIKTDLIRPLRICLELTAESSLSHLVFSQIIIIQVFQILAQLFAVDCRHRIRGLLRVLQHFVLNKNRAIHAQRQRQGVGRP